MKNVIRFYIPVIGLIGLMTSGISFAGKDPALDKLIDEAKTIHKRAIAAQGGWTSTKKLIKSAELKSTKGNTKEALELAKKALKEAELSHSQALNQRKSWAEPPYIK